MTPSPDIDKYFNVITRKLSDGSVLHIIDIQLISKELEELIDQNISKIHSGGTYNLERTKKVLRNTFNATVKPYHVPDVKLGAIAEFFIHLYFTQLGFKQECLFQNLEEQNAIKKGHDGYYSFNEEEWLMESKSTRLTPDHKPNIKLAYDDLSDKVSGKNKNAAGVILSPWDNALNHATRVGSSKDILKNLKRLSDDFIDEKYYTISDFNIIPSSTIFLDNGITTASQEDIYTSINKYMLGKKYNKLNVVCVTQKTVNLFLDYLNK